MDFDSSEWVSLPAPAKLNLFLRITGRREDGYHLLQTVFQFVDLLDEVRLRVRTDGRLRRINDLPGVPPDDDLAIRAARALKVRTGCRLGADIEVIKRIPMGGGLGGGSSDAASVLAGLNVLWDCQVSPASLAAIGVKLGADVPVFIHGQCTWAEGIGEKFTTIGVQEADYLLAFPGDSVATADIFSASDLTRDCPPLTIPGSSLPGGLCRARELMRAGNVCEPVVRRLYPRVGACLEWLERIGPARMTGTGAVCFALIEQGAAIPPGDWETRQVRGMNASPLLRAVGKLTRSDLY